MMRTRFVESVGWRSIAPVRIVGSRETTALSVRLYSSHTRLGERRRSLTVDVGCVQSGELVHMSSICIASSSGSIRSLQRDNVRWTDDLGVRVLSSPLLT
jgi:hypothetical protein